MEISGATDEGRLDRRQFEECLFVCLFVCLLACLRGHMMLRSCGRRPGRCWDAGPAGQGANDPTGLD
jgi:hypothetical protein